MPPETVYYIITFIYGMVIGSFLNVCIYRIPKSESIIKTSSHCTSCGKRIRWYDLIPVVSYLLLRGKCRNCKAKVSLQYPLIEIANGILYLVVVGVNGFNMTSVIYCLLSSALLTLSMIDIRTYEIPLGINLFILVLGFLHLLVYPENWLEYTIGFFSVSLFLYLIFFFSKGKGIGGGDIKLMAVCGFILGWKLVILGFFIGCILGSIIHILRMKISHADHVLAMGPYLSAGVWIAALWGENILTWYFGRFY